MALETAFFLAQELLKLNVFVLLGIVFAFAFLAFRFFHLVLKVLVTGVVFGAFPVVANLVGIPVPITIQSILWSAITGIVIYFIYIGISFGFKVLNAVFSPFKGGFAKKETRKIVVKKVVKEEKK